MNRASIKDAIKHQEVEGLKLVERGFGEIKDLNNGGVVVVWKDLPQDARRAGWFKIVVSSRGGKDGRTLILNKHELQYLLRNV